MTIRDCRELNALQRTTKALRIHRARDVSLPRLAYWNYDPCERHTALTPGCQHCGVSLRRHQRIGIVWLYLAGRGLLADSVGLGKTAQICGVLAMLCETGEISEGRVVIVCRPAAMGQWRDEINRMVPALNVICVNGTPAERRARYAEPWHVCIVSPSTLAGAKGTKRSRSGDIEILQTFPVHMAVYDDTDAMRNPTNRQAWAIKKLCALAERRYGVHGTPLQKRLTELWSFLEPLGGSDPGVFGTLLRFTHRFVKTGATYFYQQGLVCPDDHLTAPPHRRCQHRADGETRVCGKPIHPDPQHRKVLRTVAREVGILPEKVEEFKAKIYPLVLRRTAGDVDDVSLPAIEPSHVWLDLTSAQRTRYEEIRAGVLRQLREEGEQISHTAAMAKFTRGWQVCSGLAALDGQDSAVASTKLDWVVDKLTGDLSEEKVVCFVHFTPNVDALAARLARAGVAAVVIKGSTPKAVRDANRIAFRDDPACRVLIGTTSIEQSLNLQCARHMVCVDTILNPARMEQLAGRVRRIGSAYQTVYLHMLLTRGTLEEGFLDLLESEQALADTVWDESSPIFDTLNARQILSLVAYGNAATAA